MSIKKKYLISLISFNKQVKNHKVKFFQPQKRLSLIPFINLKTHYFCQWVQMTVSLKNS